MPRMDPLRKKSSSMRRQRDPQESIAQFLRNLLFPISSFEPSTVDRLLEAISPTWDTVIAPSLLSEFGNLATLHAIFYLASNTDEVILEVWDPSCVETKPSEVFKLAGVPDTAKRLPSSRSKAKILTLENWY